VNRKSTVRFAIVAALVFGVSILIASRPVSARSETKPKQKVVIHLSRYTENTHAALMATHFAENLQEHGAEVTMMLDVGGVRLADKRQAQNSDNGIDSQISKYYDGFVKAGGKVLVCPHCAQTAGLTEQNLRPGARIGKNLGELTDLILSADKILDY